MFIDRFFCYFMAILLIVHCPQYEYRIPIKFRHFFYKQYSFILYLLRPISQSFLSTLTKFLHEITKSQAYKVDFSALIYLRKGIQQKTRNLRKISISLTKIMHVLFVKSLKWARNRIMYFYYYKTHFYATPNESHL